MSHPIIHEIEREQCKKQVPEFRVGDTVEVRVKVREGDRERIQPFVGTVIAMKGGGIRTTFTVRRIVQGEGVERVFPLHSPSIVDVRVKHRGEVRRAKLFYLRGRTGKSTRIKGRRVETPASQQVESAQPETPTDTEAKA